MYSSDCLTNRAALGCVTTGPLHVQFGLSHQQSSIAVFNNVCAACTVRIVSPTEHLWDEFPQGRCIYSSDWTPTEQLWGVFPLVGCLYISDCLTNRAAPRCVSTATLYVQFGLARQQIISVMFLFPLSRCMYSSNCLTNRTSLGYVSTATLHVQTVSPTEQLWDVFSRPRCK